MNFLKMYYFVLDMGRVGCKSQYICFSVYHGNQRRGKEQREEEKRQPWLSSSQVISEMTKGSSFTILRALFLSCCFPLQGIFLTQGLNSGLPHWGQTLYHLSHQGISPLRSHSFRKQALPIWNWRVQGNLGNYILDHRVQIKNVIGIQRGEKKVSRMMKAWS